MKNTSEKAGEFIQKNARHIVLASSLAVAGMTSFYGNEVRAYTPTPTDAADIDECCDDIEPIELIDDSCSGDTKTRKPRRTVRRAKAQESAPARASDGSSPGMEPVRGDARKSGAERLYRAGEPGTYHVDPGTERDRGVWDNVRGLEKGFSVGRGENVTFTIVGNTTGKTRVQIFAYPIVERGQRPGRGQDFKIVQDGEQTPLVRAKANQMMQGGRPLGSNAQGRAVWSQAIHFEDLFVGPGEHRLTISNRGPDAARIRLDGVLQTAVPPDFVRGAPREIVADCSITDQDNRERRTDGTLDLVDETPRGTAGIPKPFKKGATAWNNDNGTMSGRGTLEKAYTNAEGDRVTASYETNVLTVRRQWADRVKQVCRFLRREPGLAADSTIFSGSRAE